MLFRDLDWQPREEAHYWDSAVIHLKSGDTIYLEKPVPEALRPSLDGAYVIFIRGSHNIETINRAGLPSGYEWKGHACSTEFDAQAVLDHYLAEYGVLDGQN